ncbi:MAG: PAS domain S-box protein [Oscillatoriaceae cyanobacterium Prado104]|jgi:PAS domain S-box-containing protein|nr:PAS domain S-box protein [Oscillatoriaceae cyanobacterium Prado104]
MQSQLRKAKSDRCKHKLLEVSPIGLALCRTDGTFLELNPAFAAIIGCTVAETIDLNYWEIAGSECDCQETKYLQTSSKNNSRAGAIETTYKFKDGHLVPVQVSERVIEKDGERLLWVSAEAILNLDGENSSDSQTAAANSCNSNLERSLAQRTAELAESNAQLLEAREKLRLQNQILDNIRESVICTDINGQIISWNKASERLYGYQENEVKGKNIFLIYPPEDRELMYQKIVDPLLEKGTNEVEVVACRKSGEQFYVHVSLSLLKDSNGEVCGTIGYSTDISDRKALEQELARKQALFDAFFIDSPVGLCILNEEFKFVQINSALAQINGFSIAEHIGKNIGEILPPEATSILVPLYQEVLDTKKPQLCIEISGETPQLPEVMRHFTASYFPLLDGKEEAIGIGAVVIETTDRKQTEAALQKSEQLYRKLASNFPNGAVMLFDRDLRYTLAEGTELAAVGLSKELMEGKTIWEIFPEEFCGAVEPNYRAALSGETVVTEFTYSSQHYLAYTLPVRNDRQEITGGMLMTQNISDRKLAEEALRESEERYRRIVETAAEGMWSIDALNNTTFVNQKMADMLGYKIEEMLGESLFAFMDSEGMAIARSNLKRQRLGMGEQYDFKFRRRDGNDVWAIVSASTLFDKQGSYAGLFAMVADITDRKQAEAALQQSEAKFRSLYELTSLPVLMLDDKGICSANSAIVELFRYTSQYDLCGKHQAEISPPIQPNGRDSLSLAAEMIALACERGNHRFEWIHRRADGTDFPTEVVLTPIEMDDRIIIEAVVQDLTERKQAEQILVRSEQSLRQQAQREKLLNQIASQIRNSLDLDTILETAVQEIRNLIQLDWCLFTWYRPNSNPPVWETVYEAKKTDLPSSLGSYVIDEKTSVIAQHLLRLEMLRIDDVNTFPDLEVCNIFRSWGVNSVLSLPIQTTAGDIGLICCHQAQKVGNWSDSDVELMQAVAAQIAIAIDHAELYTQTRKTALQAQAQAQKLEQTLHQLQRTQSQLIQSEKMSSLGQLVAGVAHEINNPVNFIYGNLTYANEYTKSLLKVLQLYQQEYPQPNAAILEELEKAEIDYLVEDLPKILSSMKVGADRIRDIVLSLRNFSRLDEAEMKRADIHEGIESTLLILQNRLKNKADRPPIQVIKEYGNLPLVECYPGQLNQVFMNLIGNAIDALELEVNNSKSPKKSRDKNKKLEIRIRTEVTDDRSIIVKIADTGSGMSEEVQKRLFDPFFTTKPIGKGTGLGLAISHSIVVEKHGGQLSCYSVVGEGSEFSIELPLR